MKIAWNIVVVGTAMSTSYVVGYALGQHFGPIGMVLGGLSGFAIGWIAGGFLEK